MEGADADLGEEAHHDHLQAGQEEEDGEDDERVVVDPGVAGVDEAFPEGLQPAAHEVRAEARHRVRGHLVHHDQDRQLRRRRYGKAKG